MSRVTYSAILALAVMAILGPPSARADLFNLNVAYCGSCVSGSGPWGTVEVTNTGGTGPNHNNNDQVTIDVKLTTTGLVFHDAGLDSFAFNSTTDLSGATFAEVLLDGTTWTFVNNGGNADGAGNFQYHYECASGSNQCKDAVAATASTPAEFKFTINLAGLDKSSFETRNSNASNVDFAVNVANSLGSGCTGMIGGGNGTGNSTAVAGTSTCTDPPVTPEPTSIAFFGTGLFGLGVVLRKKFARS